MDNMDVKEKLEFSAQSLNHLNVTRKWTMFFSVLGIIFVGLMIIFAILMITGGLIRSIPDGPMSGFAFGGIGFLYILIAIVYFFPIYFLLRFSNYAKKAILYKDEFYLEVAMKNLKNHYMFMGILTIIGIVLYFIFGLAFSIGALMHY